MTVAALHRSRRRRSRAGYTVVELMMALALFFGGVLALVSMQKLQMRANADSRNLAIAQRIAETWSGQLQMESLAWRSTLASTAWLGAVDNGWTRPAYVTGRVGGAFDALGNPLTDSSTDLQQARFCTNVRLTYLFQPNTPVVGNGLMRAEIRVYWLRDGEAVTNPADGLCPTGPNAAELKTIGSSVDRYEFVYQTTGVRQHLAI
jgi:Tfp pilus assembly protein PilV